MKRKLLFNSNGICNWISFTIDEDFDPLCIGSNSQGLNSKKNGKDLFLFSDSVKRV